MNSLDSPELNTGVHLNRSSCRLTSSSILLGTFLLLSAVQASADTYFNSAESGCNGSDPNVLWCDDFEDGSWAQTYGEVDNAANDGWNMTPFSSPCAAAYPSGCPAGVALLGTPTNGGVCGNAGVAGTNCTASSGFRNGHSQKPFMGDHNFSGKQSVDEFYFRYYLKDLPGSSIGQEKMLSVNLCCAGKGGIDFASFFSWANPWRTINVTVYAEDANRSLNLSNIHLTVGTWWFIEYHIKLNTPGASNGVYEAWVDNCGTNGTSCSGTPTLRARHTDVKWRNSGNTGRVGSLWLENWSNPGGVGEVYYDQIKVSKVGPIGFAGGAGSPPPPPSSYPSPGNLQVQ